MNRRQASKVSSKCTENSNSWCRWQIVRLKASLLSDTRLVLFLILSVREDSAGQSPVYATRFPNHAANKASMEMLKNSRSIPENALANPAFEPDITPQC